MSGKPSHQGVEEFCLALKRIVESETRIIQLQQEVKERQDTIASLGLEHKDASLALFRLMGEMDVDTRGNTGWEGRMKWFLVEFYRQLTR